MGRPRARFAAAFVAASLSVAASPAAAEDAPPQPPSPLAPRSATVAIVLEVVSPAGGAGCLYRRRYLPGALVLAGSLVSGGTLAYAAATSDRDGVILNGVALALIRVVGIAAAARPDPEPSVPPAVSSGNPAAGVPQTPPGVAASLPTPPVIGLSHAFAF